MVNGGRETMEMRDWRNLPKSTFSRIKVFRIRGNFPIQNFPKDPTRNLKVGGQS